MQRNPVNPVTNMLMKRLTGQQGGHINGVAQVWAPLYSGTLMYGIVYIGVHVAKFYSWL